MNALLDKFPEEIVQGTPLEKYGVVNQEKVMKADLAYIANRDGTFYVYKHRDGLTGNFSEFAFDRMVFESAMRLLKKKFKCNQQIAIVFNRERRVK